MRDRDGAEVWIVAVKGSFVIGADGHQALEKEQAEVSRVPVFSSEPGLSSLICESDLIHLKNKTDVIAHGVACAPNGTRASAVDVRLKVGPVDKTLRVHGDRHWQRGPLGLRLDAPEPFSTMPITFERAFGGVDQLASESDHARWEPANPVGTGLATKREHLSGTRAPNVEDPRWPYADGRKSRPAGFGPIARHWAPRVAWAGTYDDAWEQTRKPLVPADFDDRFYQCAPVDQQVDGHLKGGEVVEVHNMTADGLLCFRLPRVALAMTTHFYDGTMAQHRAKLHTVMLYPDKRRFVLGWHSHLPCHHKVNKLKVTEVTLKKRVNVPRNELESGMWLGE